LVKTVPLIARLTAKSLAKEAAKGKKITRPLAAKTMATQTQKVLGNPMTCAKALMKSSQKANQAVKSATKAR
jgi:hypothetical protein